MRGIAGSLAGLATAGPRPMFPIDIEGAEPAAALTSLLGEA